jgi:hypothetical protein
MSGPSAVLNGGARLRRALINLVTQEKKNGCSGMGGTLVDPHVPWFLFIMGFSQGSAGASPYQELDKYGFRILS